jgi:hypothetical protein
MKKLYRFGVRLLSNPNVRPIEVWLFRAAVAYLAVKLGIQAGGDVSQVA